MIYPVSGSLFIYNLYQQADERFVDMPDLLNLIMKEVISDGKGSKSSAGYFNLSAYRVLNA